METNQAMTKELSPVAQEVLNAYMDEDRAGSLALAAALGAAADQVECDMPDDNAYAAGFDAALGEIQAIAAELMRSA